MKQKHSMTFYTTFLFSEPCRVLAAEKRKDGIKTSWRGIQLKGHQDNQAKGSG
jgi:hypothetical protein